MVKNYVLVFAILAVLLLGFAYGKTDDVGIMDAGLGVNIDYPNGLFNYLITYFTWDYIPGDYQINNCSYRLNGIMYSMNNCIPGDVAFSLPLTDDGDYILKLYFNYSFNSEPDESYLVPVSSASFLIDTLPPQISIVSPSNNNYNYTIPEVNFDIVEANIGSCWFSNDFGATNISISNCLNGNNTFYFNSSEGWNTWTIWANDTLSHLNSSSTTFWIDSIYPEIQFSDKTTPSENFSQEWIYAEITASDTNLANTTIYLHNKTSLVDFAPGLFVNFTGLPDGIYDLNATAFDTIGHANSTETRVVTLDSHAPDITLISPSNNRLFEASFSEVFPEFNVSDFSEIANCSLIVNNTIVQTIHGPEGSCKYPCIPNTEFLSLSKDTTQNFSLTSLSSGEYSWQVSCIENFEPFNKVGNSEIQSFTILSGLTFPEGTIYTNLSEVSDITNVNFFVANSFGIINWTEPLDLSRGLDWALYINLSDNRVEVKASSTEAPELNKPAMITLYNISWTKPEVLRDGAPCSSSECTILNYSNTTQTIIFSVAGFSVYTTREYEEPKIISYSGRSGSSGSSCWTNWTCTSWTSCINSQQTRICTKLIDYCIADSKPSETQSCNLPLPVQTATPEVEQPPVKEPKIQIESQGRNWLGITGAAIGANAAPIAGAIVFIIIIVASYIFVRVKNQKESQRIKRFLLEVRKLSPKW